MAAETVEVEIPGVKTALCTPIFPKKPNLWRCTVEKDDNSIYITEFGSTENKLFENLREAITIKPPSKDVQEAIADYEKKWKEKHPLQRKATK